MTPVVSSFRSVRQDRSSPVWSISMATVSCGRPAFRCFLSASAALFNGMSRLGSCSGASMPSGFGRVT